MGEVSVGTIIVLVLILLIIGACFVAYIQIRKKIREISSVAFGTPNFLEGMQKMEAEVAATPKSVSSGTGLYLPKITKDFPEFHFDEMKKRAENVLVSYLTSIDRMDASLLKEGTSELKEHLTMRIDMLRGSGQKEVFEKIKVHRTEINQYRKLKGRVSIVMQSAVEYMHHTEKDGKVIQGSTERLKQSKYNVELIYIQDRSIVENANDTGLGLNCPNCGAPLSSVGAKVCAYCGTPIMEFSIRVWNFSSVTEVS